MTSARRDLLVGLGLALLCAALGFINLAGSPPYAEDEGTYTSQAMALFDGRLAPYTYWYDHPPLGWITLAPLLWFFHAIGTGDQTFIAAARGAAVVASALTVFLLYRLARQLHVRWGLAALMGAALILSPLFSSYSRQAYLDVLALPWIVGALVLLFSPHRGLWPHLAAGLVFACGVLTKETMALAGPALLVALLHRKRWSTRTFSVVGFLSTGALVLAFYPLLAALRGELFHSEDRVSLIDALSYQFLTRTGSGSVWQPGSGRHELVVSWWIADPWLLTAGVVGAVIGLRRRSRRWILVLLATFALPLVLGSGYLPAMYIVAVLPFLALGTAVGADAAWSALLRASARRGLSARAPIHRVVAGGLALSVAAATSPTWAPQGAQLLTVDQNADWRSALRYTQEHVPTDAVVSVPYSMWQDVAQDRGRQQWRVIVTEKVDLDSAFNKEHPGGWRAIDYVVVGPIVRQNIDSLGLSVMGEVVKNSQEVATYGEWSVRRVIKG